MSMNNLKLTGVFVWAVIFAFSGWTETYAQNKEIEFNHLFDKTFQQESVRSPNWMKSGAFFTTLVNNEEEETTELRKYDIRDKSYEVLVTEELLTNINSGEEIKIGNYSFSGDESQLLIQTDIEGVWRRSRLAVYYVYNLASKQLDKVNQDDVKIGNAEFSPDGSKVAYTKENNLYIFDIDNYATKQITFDGDKNKIINGSTDWVYEEEFSFAKAWFWSPYGNSIAYYRFDESRVKEFSFPTYGGLYPELVTYKYPKAGEQNAVVTIGVYNLETGETKWMNIGDTDDQYIVRINWTNKNDKLAIRRMNRLQNKQDLMIADVENGSTKIIKTEVSDTWIDENDDLTFLGDNEEFIYVSEESGYNHIYLYNFDGKRARQITKGDWNVTRVNGIDEEREVIYFTASKESPLERHLYRVNFNGKSLKKLTEESGSHAVNMNGDFTYYLDYFSSDSSPLKVTLHNRKGEEVRVLEDNADLQNRMKEYNLPEKEFFTVDLHDTLSLNAWMIKPPNFDSNKKYPVLMYVYGGPGSQTVMNRFETGQRPMWHNYLASRGYIIVSVDNRGTGARSAEFKKIIYKNLGKYEVADQIAAAEKISKFKYIDADRIGIWGWSYGGYMSSLALARGNDVFDLAIAVAPVTSWRYYDTIYTERYMQTPQLNPEGYNEGAPLNHAEKIKGDYLLVHGTADDNVHFQNAVEMAAALQNNGIAFESMYYPDKAHGIGGGATRKHLYEMLSSFIFENL
jgi:dipeptidyl-peptidase-4